MKVIVHILDSTVGVPVLSDALLDYGSDFGDFLREHIYRVETTDEKKTCQFCREESQVYQKIAAFAESGLEEETFIEISRNMAAWLYEIMNQNIEIPQADFGRSAILHFSPGL